MTGTLLRHSLAIFIAVLAMAADDRPTFDVASIKENRSGEIRTTLLPYPDGTLKIENNSARQLIRAAYGVWDYQLVGLPDWVDQRHYDITARASGPASRPQLMGMLQRLLEERFALTCRRESREQPIFALVQASPGKTGPGLTRAKPEDADGRLSPVHGTADGTMAGQAATMADLAHTLSNLQGRLVVDKTGLTGTFNFTLKAARGGPDDLARPLPAGVSPDRLPGSQDGLPPMPTALREQLGLRLDAQRGPVDVLVVERITPPTAD
jgi:uncharacterized protein (TIGR03435 family)